MQIKIKDFFKDPFIFFLITINYMIPPSIYSIIPSMGRQILNAWDKLIGIPVFLLCVVLIISTKQSLIGDIITYFWYKIFATVVVTLIVSGTITGGGAFRHLRQLSIICYIALALKYNFKLTIRRLTYLLSALVILNFLTILLYPGGMYNDGNWENYFLGYDNGHVVVFMPALFFTLEYSYLEKKYMLMILTWLSVFSSALICKSGVTICGIVVFVVLLTIIQVPVARKYLFNWKSVFAFICCMFLFIVIFRKQMDYRDLFLIYLKKDSNLTERTVLWDRALGYIRENPWLGMGDNTEKNLGMFMLRTQRLTYSHNEILDILVRSGIIGLLLYFNCIIRTFVMAKRRKDSRIKIWLVFMTVYWMMMMFESYSNYSFYYMYFVILLFPRFENNISNYCLMKNKKYIFNVIKNVDS